MYVCIYIHTHTHIHAHITYTCANIHLHTYVDVYRYTYTYTYMCICIICIHICLYIHVHTTFIYTNEVHTQRHHTNVLGFYKNGSHLMPTHICPIAWLLHEDVGGPTQEVVCPRQIHKDNTLRLRSTLPPGSVRYLF